MLKAIKFGCLTRDSCVMLTACQQAVSKICMTYTYYCVYNAGLLMMDRETLRNT